MSKTYFVYIMASRSRRLYTGVTSDLCRRAWEHRTGAIQGFTSKYQITSLVHFEETLDVQAAIAREKEIKGWGRERRCRLIERSNAGWRDLAADWFGTLAG